MLVFLFALIATADPIHGSFMCNGPDVVGRPAWQLTDLDLSIEKDQQQVEHLKLNAKFYFLVCKEKQGNYAFENLTLPTHRVIVFSELRRDKEKRLFFAELNSQSEFGPHTASMFLPLKNFLTKSEMNDYKNGKTLEKTLILRLGHPAVSNPDEHYTDGLDGYYLSWGITKAKLILDPNAMPTLEFIR